MASDDRPLRAQEEGAPAATADARGLFSHPGVDLPTLGLAALLWGGLIANFLWFVRDPAPVWIHVLVSVFFLNTSFTVWHEGVHGTVFRPRWANDLVGICGTYPAMIPYFMIRKVHHLHHEHTNDPARDPDYWFTEASIWTLPLRYLAGIRRARAVYLRSDPPAWEQWVDRSLSLSVLGLVALAAWQGQLAAVLWVWILPKLIAMWIHAWYVNYLPHRRLPAERYRDTRIFPMGWLSPLMLFHNYHGLHHAWQTVPWHRYGRAFRAKRGFLEARGAPVRERLSQL